MFLEYLFRKFRSHSLRKTYEEILRREYQLSAGEYEESEKDELTDVVKESVTESEELAFRMLDTGQRIGVPNHYWRELMASLLGSITNRSEVEDRNFFIGQVPDPRFNACVLPVSDKHFLLLINAGLSLFVFRMSRIFIASSRFRFDDMVFEPEITTEQANRLSGENLDAMVDSCHCMPLRLEQPVLIKTAQLLCEAIELFVLAHELAHVFLHAKGLVPEKEEHVADLVGYQLYQGISDQLALSWGAPKQISQALLAAAPHLFFVLADQLAERLRTKGVEVADSHPDCKLRSLVLWETQSQYETDAVMKRVNEITLHFFGMVAET